MNEIKAGTRAPSFPSGVSTCASRPETCDKCGLSYSVWFTDSDLWNLACPKGGMLCMECFIEKAERVGITTTGWKLLPEERAK